MTARAVPRVLSIAGTDPTGGAGLQADLKSIGALGGYGMAVVTTLVAQNTRGVRAVHAPPSDFLRAQLDAVSDDVEIDAVKIGMLHTSAYVETVSAWLDQVNPPVVVLDPVMVATSGDRLLDESAVAAVRALCRRATLVTPNLPELGVLVDRPWATTWDEAVTQAQTLSASTGAVVLLKGGHLAGRRCPDAIVDGADVFEVEGERVETANTHGTGCSLSSAMATLRAQGMTWPEALVRAKQWLTGALRAADALEVGRGNGPVDHFHELRSASAPWSTTAWERGREVRDDVDLCPFVADLRDGTLAESAFAWYLAQDALYLREYARVLARTSAAAPTRDAQEFWADSARAALLEEERLHSARLGEERPHPAPATIAYTDHLHAASAGGDYAEMVAAVLPCFWLYRDLGARWATIPRAGHAYADWLDAYGDVGFSASTDRAIALADAAASEASPAQRARMDEAFARSLRHELAFFAAPLGALVTV